MSSDASRTQGFDVVGVGECSVDEVWVAPGLKLGGKSRAEQWSRLGGGQVATAMVACARLGLSAAYVGAVGDDDDGRFVEHGLREERVDTRALQRVAGGSTRRALILVAGAERTIVDRRDSNVRIDPLRLDHALVTSARVLHVDATDLGASLLAARAAKGAGVKISIDVDAPHPHLDELLALADLCFLAEGLPEQLSGETTLGAALLAIRKKSNGIVGVTLGQNGAAALDGDRLVLSPAFPTDVVDSTACGDTFRAAAICAFLAERPIPELLRFANAAASLKCRAIGRSGCPRRDEVDALLGRHGAR